jgi:hypothetical protein
MVRLRALERQKMHGVLTRVYLPVPKAGESMEGKNPGNVAGGLKA